MVDRRVARVEDDLRDGAFRAMDAPARARALADMTTTSVRMARAGGGVERGFRVFEFFDCT
jgi:hypothetical protein